MGDATREYFVAVFGETLEILERECIPHLVIGSVAKSCQLGDDWDPASDIDLIVTQKDAERCLEVFPAHGYATHVRDPSWIYKLAKPNVTIDLIFRSSGRIEMSDDIVERAVPVCFERLAIRVPSIEDMAVHYVLMDSDERPGHWYDGVRYLDLVTDWDYVAERGIELAPRKILAALLYAADVGIDVPDATLHRIASAAQL